MESWEEAGKLAAEERLGDKILWTKPHWMTSKQWSDYQIERAKQIAADDKSKTQGRR